MRSKPILILSIALAVTACGTAARSRTTGAQASSTRQQQTDYTTHRVKWYEDLYAIAARYGLSGEELMYFNGMKNPTVSKGQVLKIPKGPVKVPYGWFSDDSVGSPETPRETRPAGGGTEPATLPPQTRPQIDSSLYFFPKKTVRLTLLLPFNTGGNASESNMDFYAGVLLAVKDVEEEEGTGTRLRVYDVSGSAMPERNVFEESDVVLGPVSVSDLITALGVCSDNATIVSPLDQRALTLASDNHNFVQAPTPAEYQYADMARWAADDWHHGEQVVLVYERGADSRVPDAVAAALDRIHLPYTPLGYNISREENTINAALAETLHDKGMNRVLVASENESFAEDVIRNASMLMNKGYEVTLYAPSRVRTFDSIDLGTLHETELHISSPYFVDYTDPAVQAFVVAYRSLFNTEPSQFAFQGYDTARYFIGLVGKYGNGWVRRVNDGRRRALHTDFDFQRQPGGSYVNTAVRRIVYGNTYDTYLVR